MILQQKLKYLRKQMGLSQLELAEKLQVSRQAVSGWEAGTSKPSTESLKSLGALYNVPLEYLLNEDTTEPNHAELKTEKIPGQGSNIKKRSIVLILIGIGIVSIILCAMFMQDRKEDLIQMNHIEGSEMEATENFELKW